jgi:RND family efflux transporter MFP subunit
MRFWISDTHGGRKMRFGYKQVVFVAVIALIVVATLVTRIRSEKVTAASTKAPPPRASFAVASKGPIANTLTVAGEFLPYQEVDIHAKVTGFIKKISVDIGDHVHGGQALATLEVPELGAQVEGADASVRHSKEEIVRAHNEVARVEADHAVLHMASERLQKAAAARPGLVAQQEIDEAVAKDRASQAQLDAVRSAVSSAEQQLDVSKANRSQVSALWDYSHIVAPFDGVITWRYADTGALVQAGTSSSSSQPVVKLAQVNVLRLRVPVPESMASQIRIAAPADITVQATKEHLSARISRFTGSLDRATRTMQVEFEIPNANHHLSPGMYADVVLRIEGRNDAITVPVEAVERNGEHATLLVLDRENRVSARRVELGIQEPTSVEVLAGLNAGDRVIIGNLSSYHDGEIVDPQPSALAHTEANTSGGNR